MSVLAVNVCSLIGGVLLLASPVAYGAVALSQPFSVNTGVPRQDFDQDGLPDAYEINVGLNWRVADSGDDPDGDGKTNLQEYHTGTDPITADNLQAMRALSEIFTVGTGGLVVAADIDADGMPDWWERRYGLDPNAADGGGDYDLDGKSNLTEYLSGHDPTQDELMRQALAFSRTFGLDTGGGLRDTDGDGIPDWWERLFFTNATVALRLVDFDEDQHNNFEEFLAGTDPTNRESVLRIVEVRPGPLSVVRWASIAAHTYSLWRFNPDTTAFERIASNVVATPPINSYTNGAPTQRELYRISTSP